MPDRLTEQELQVIEEAPTRHLSPLTATYACRIVKELAPRAVAELRELRDELRIGNSLTAKLTDKCRELEAIVAKLPVTEEQQ